MKTTAQALIVAGVMLSVAALANAQPHHAGPHAGGPHAGGMHPGTFPHHYNPFVPPPRVIRLYPRRPMYVSPRIVYPLTLTPRTVVVLPEPDPADVIRAQLETLKTEYYKLSQTRQSLLNWLATSGQSASATTRIKVETQIVMIERDCRRIAGQVAELELALIES